MDKINSLNLNQKSCDERNYLNFPQTKDIWYKMVLKTILKFLEFPTAG